jgi:hypothetical protein
MHSHIPPHYYEPGFTTSEETAGQLCNLSHSSLAAPDLEPRSRTLVLMTRSCSCRSASSARVREPPKMSAISAILWLDGLSTVPCRSSSRCIEAAERTSSCSADGCHRKSDTGSFESSISYEVVGLSRVGRVFPPHLVDDPAQRVSDGLCGGRSETDGGIEVFSGEGKRRRRSARLIRNPRGIQDGRGWRRRGFRPRQRRLLWSVRRNKLQKLETLRDAEAGEAPSPKCDSEMRSDELEYGRRECVGMTEELEDVDHSGLRAGCAVYAQRRISIPRN